MTKWKESNVDNVEGYTGKNANEDHHTRNILDKLKKLKEKKRFENFANIKPLENIYDSFVKAKKKDKKKDKSETPLQEGLDNGMMNGNEWSRLDDDDYDGHDNVDDEGADIDAGMGISEGINWLREMVKYIFDMIETFFYIIAIFIYLIFSAEDPDSKRWTNFFTDGTSWRTKFNEEEEQDIDLIFSYILYGMSIMFSSVITYGLYFYMFYSETDENKLNNPDRARKPQFCSADILTPFFSLDHDRFSEFYKSHLYSDAALSEGKEEKLKDNAMSWFYAVFSPFLYLTYIMFGDAVFAISTLNSIIMKHIPNGVKSMQQFLSNYGIKFSNGFIFFGLAIVVVNLVFNFGGAIKSMILDGVLNADIMKSGIMGAFLILLTVLPSLTNFLHSFSSTYTVVDPIVVEGEMVGGAEKEDGKNNDKENAKLFNKEQRNIRTQARMENNETFIDTKGYLYLTAIERNAWAMYSFDRLTKWLYNTLRFFIGIMFGLFFVPLFFVIYIICFMVITPIASLGNLFTQMRFNIDIHKQLDDDEFYNLFYVDSKGKSSKIDDAEVKRVVDREFPKHWFPRYMVVFIDVIFKIFKNLFYFTFLLLFIVMFAYASSDIGSLANNGDLQTNLPPLLLGCFALLSAFYIFKIYKKVTTEGGDVERFLRDFLGIRPTPTPTPTPTQSGGNVFEDIGKGIGDAANNVGKFVGDTANNVGKFVGDAAEVVQNKAQDMVNNTSDLFNKEVNVENVERKEDETETEYNERKEKIKNLGSSRGKERRDAVMEDIIDVFNYAKGEIPYYEDNRWDKVFNVFKEALLLRYNNNIKYDSKESTNQFDNTRNVQNMKKDEWRAGIYRYLTSTFGDYTPLRAIFKEAPKDHPVNVMFSERQCAESYSNQKKMDDEEEEKK